ncbi:hypothetical protein GX586_16065 [bacterium]|nr:hypothetical protein [bacterium]
MMFEPPAGPVVAEALARAMKQQDQAARDAVMYRRALYYGAMRDLLFTRIDTAFSDGRERQALKRMSTVSLNLVRYVIDTLAVVYRYGASRTWHDAKETIQDGRRVTANPAATAAYARIMEQCEANETFDYANKMCLLTGDCMMRYEYGRWGHRLYPMTRDVCDVIQDDDDPRRVRGVLWSVTLTDTPIFQANLTGLIRRRWFLADAEKTTEYDMNGRAVDTVPNPYGPLNERETAPLLNVFYPFLDFHDGYRPYTFWREYQDEVLYDLALDVCMWLTYLNGQLKFSTLKQVYEVPSERAALAGKPATQVMGWTGVYQGPPGGTVGVLDYTVALDMTVNVLRSKLEMFCATHDMPTNLFSVEATQSASGVRVKLDRVALAEMRGQQVKHYIARERTLAKIVQYASQYGFERYPSEDRIEGSLAPLRVTVDFGEPPQAQDPEDDRAQWQWEFDRGISTPEDYLVMKHPDMTPESAKDLIATNLSERAARDAAVTDARIFGSLPATSPTVDEDEQP